MLDERFNYLFMMIVNSVSEMNDSMKKVRLT